MSYGLTESGFASKRAADIATDLQATLRASSAFGPEADFGADTVLGQLVSAVAREMAEAWEAAGALYGAFSLDASGAALENALGLFGMTKLAATKAKGYVRCYGTNGTVIPPAAEPPTSGGVLRRSSDGALFNVLADPEGGDWTIASGYVDVLVEAQEAGALTVDNGQIGGDTGSTERSAAIVFPVSGWTGVWNPAAEGGGKPVLQPFIAGTDIESDASFRARALDDMKGLGNSTDHAIRRKVIQATTPDGLTFLTAARVLSNRSMEEDENGQPAKSFWVVVWPNALTDDQKTAILEAIWASCPAGIECWPGPAGDNQVTGTVQDAAGLDQSIGFSYATEAFIYVRVEIVRDAALFPADGSDQVKTALQAYGDALQVGDDVISSDIVSLLAEIPGVRDVKLQLAQAPDTDDNISTVIPAASWPSQISSLSISAGSIARFAATTAARTVVTLS